MNNPIRVQEVLTMNDCVYVDIEYDEAEPETYRSIIVSLGEGVDYRFAGGDIQADFAEALLFANQIARQRNLSVVHGRAADDYLSYLLEQLKRTKALLDHIADLLADEKNDNDSDPGRHRIG